MEVTNDFTWINIKQAPPEKLAKNGINRDYSAISATLGVARMAE